MKSLSILLVLLIATVAQAQPAPPNDPNLGDPAQIQAFHDWMRVSSDRVAWTYSPVTPTGDMKLSVDFFRRHANDLLVVFEGANVAPNSVVHAFALMDHGRVLSNAWFDEYDRLSGVRTQEEAQALGRIFEYAVLGTVATHAAATLAVADHAVACDALIDHADNLPTPHELTAWLEALAEVATWAANR